MVGVSTSAAGLARVKFERRRRNIAESIDSSEDNDSDPESLDEEVVEGGNGEYEVGKIIAGCYDQVDISNYYIRRREMGDMEGTGGE